MPEAVHFDHYEVLTREDGSLFELGRGAMGITYKAFDTNLRVPVALKVISGAFLHSEVARQRFVREARSAAKLRHRHVASVFHLGTEGDAWFYAMEFIDGETVEALIQRQGPLNPWLALQIARQVARALNAAVSHGLVHRDIKPANLMLVREDDEVMVKVIDFGLAKSSVPGEGEDAAAASLGGFAGTPHFASPEQLEEKESDVRSDIYSLGATLWYMLAGQAPFGGSVAQVMSQHLSKPPPFEQLHHLAAPIRELLRKMLEKDPAARFQTPAELRREIEECLEQVAETSPAGATPNNETENLSTVLDEASSQADESPFELGNEVAGRYRISEALGETNTGRAFRAYDRERQRDVRLLVLNGEFVADAAAYTQLEQEVEKIMAHPHANLLAIHGLETMRHASFVVFAWTDGFSLLELLRIRRELDLEEALPLLAQAAAGVDHALAHGLSRVDLALHQIHLHFPQPIEEQAILRAPVATWPAFSLKLNPLTIARQLSTSDTWVGGQTMVGGLSAGAAANDENAGPRYLQTLAALLYELLGGALSPMLLATAGTQAPRYTPLATLSEEGNEVLKRALDPAQSFASAQGFYQALETLGALERTPLGMGKALPARPPGARPRLQGIPMPPLPPGTKRFPRKFLSGVLTVLMLGVALLFLAQRDDEPTASTEPSAGENRHEESREETPPLTHDAPEATPMDAPPLTSPAPTRQDLLRQAAAEAEQLERREDWPAALKAWLQIEKEFPEANSGRDRLEILLEQLRTRSPKLTAKEFDAMRPQVLEAAQLGTLGAMMLLGDHLREREPATAFNWYSAAAARGEPSALTLLGLMLSNGVPGVTAPDFAKAVQCFEAAAAQDDIAGKYALADCYLSDAKGVVRNEKRAVELLREAVAANSAVAMNRLGDYIRNQGVAKEKARAKAQPNATYGVAAKEEFAEALRLFTAASEGGHLNALGNLGVMHLNGEGVPAPNPKKGVELILKGAKAGDPFCMRLYARWLEVGKESEQSALESTSWYREAAAAGDRIAADWCAKNGVEFTRKSARSNAL